MIGPDLPVPHRVALAWRARCRAERAAGRLAGIREAAEVARGYPVDEHGNLSADPVDAAKQAAAEILTAIEALASKETSDAAR